MPCRGSIPKMEKDAGSLAVAGDANMLATSKSILAATFIVTSFQWVAPSAPIIISRLRPRRFERGVMPRKLRGGAVDVVGNAVHIIEIAMGRLRKPDRTNGRKMGALFGPASTAAGITTAMVGADPAETTIPGHAGPYKKLVVVEEVDGSSEETIP